MWFNSVKNTVLLFVLIMISCGNFSEKYVVENGTLITENGRWETYAYQSTQNRTEFFNSFFTKLAGSKKLQQQIETRLSEAEIKASCKRDLNHLEQHEQTIYYTSNF